MNKFFLLTIFLIFLSGCTSQQTADDTVTLVTQQCIQLCQKALNEGKDLSNGPCLSDNNPDWTIENWVCDVAHSPRQPVDNQRENQCDEWWEGYQQGKAPNFVEVDPNCEFVKIR